MLRTSAPLNSALGVTTMGISLSWVAVEGLSDHEALSRLSLSKTDKPCTYPFRGVASHSLKNGWYLIAAGRCDHRIGNAESMSALSQGCRAVACAIEEHVNFASCELWANGRRLWRVEHQGDEDPENLSTEGELPQRVDELLATVESQDSENLDGHFHMDIPLILAKELSGYRHDEMNPTIEASPYEELAEHPAKAAWWKLWK